MSPLLVTAAPSSLTYFSHILWCQNYDFPAGVIATFFTADEYKIEYVKGDDTVGRKWMFMSRTPKNHNAVRDDTGFAQRQRPRPSRTGIEIMQRYVTQVRY